MLPQASVLRFPLVRIDSTATEAVVATVRRLSKAQSLREIMDVVTRAARTLLAADGVTFVLRDGDRCYYAEEDAISPLWKGQRFPMRACISGWCMAERQAVVIRDIYQDPRIPMDAYRSTFVRSLAMVPVREDDPIAAMGAYWSQIRGASSAELELLQMIANAAALAVAKIELDQERVRTRELIDHASEGIFLADLDGRYTDVNDAGCRMLGYTRDEIVGKTMKDIIPPEQEEQLLRHRERLLGGGTDVGEWLLRRNDQTFLSVEVSAKIVPNGRWQAFVRDITDRKRTEREQKFLVELGTVLPSTLEVDQALSKIVALAVRDTADICVIDLLDHHNVLCRARVGYRDSDKTTLFDTHGRPLCWDKAASRKDGAPILIEALTAEVATSWGLSDEQIDSLQISGFRSAIEVPLRARGKTIGRLLLVATEAPKFEMRDLPFAEAIGTLAALSLDNKQLYCGAKQATKARDEVLGIVAHDLRNPLAAVASLAAVLQRKGHERQVGKEIANAADRMNRLIGDLLDITRIESGRLSLKRVRLSPVELVSDALEGQMRLASAAGLGLHLAVAPELPDIWADRDRLLQVFENLIGNSTKFTKRGGQITLHTAVIGDDVLFSVTDTGRGISASHLPHVFDRFWQAPEDTHRGLGFGLAIVKGIVETHGGRVWVQSAPGQGSTFFFTIPTAAPQTTATRAVQ